MRTKLTYVNLICCYLNTILKFSLSVYTALVIVLILINEQNKLKEGLPVC